MTDSLDSDLGKSTVMRSEYGRRTITRDDLRTAEYSRFIPKFPTSATTVSQVLRRFEWQISFIRRGRDTMAAILRCPPAKLYDMQTTMGESMGTATSSDRKMCSSQRKSATSDQPVLLEPRQSVLQRPHRRCHQYNS